MIVVSNIHTAAFYEVSYSVSVKEKYLLCNEMSKLIVQNAPVFLYWIQIVRKQRDGIYRVHIL